MQSMLEPLGVGMILAAILIAFLAMITPSFKLSEWDDHEWHPSFLFCFSCALALVGLFFLLLGSGVLTF